MTLYVIPDLVWDWDDENQWWVTDCIFGTFFIYGPSNLLIGGFQQSTHHTIELAQSAANDLYKAKMAEGLKVATVEELRAAIKEMEPPQ